MPPRAREQLVPRGVAADRTEREERLARRARANVGHFETSTRPRGGSTSARRVSALASSCRRMCIRRARRDARASAPSARAAGARETSRDERHAERSIRARKAVEPAAVVVVARRTLEREPSSARALIGADDLDLASASRPCRRTSPTRDLGDAVCATSRST